MDQFDAEKRAVELDDRGWERAELRVDVTLNPGLLQRVLPALEHEHPRVRAFVAVRCEGTRLRRSVELVSRAEQQDLLQGVISLRRDELRGHAELVPYLVRSAACARSVSGFASAKGARLASARPWEVRVDIKSLGTGQFLNVRFDSFKEYGRSGNLYWLDTEREDPILWLDSDNTELAEMFNSRGTRGPRARIRDIAFRMVAMGAWTQLFMRAASHVQTEDGQPEYGWEEGVLKSVLPRMFPDIKDHESRCRALRELFESDGTGGVLERFDGLLQRQHSLGEHWNKLLAEIMEE